MSLYFWHKKLAKQVIIFFLTNTLADKILHIILKVHFWQYNRVDKVSYLEVTNDIRFLLLHVKIFFFKV